MEHTQVGTPWVCSAFNGIMTAMQTEETLRIICLVLTAISTLVSIITSVVVWYKKAKADGKITQEELLDLLDIGKDAKEKIENIIEEAQKENAKD